MADLPTLDQSLYQFSNVQAGRKLPQRYPARSRDAPAAANPEQGKTNTAKEDYNTQAFMHEHRSSRRYILEREKKKKKPFEVVQEQALWSKSKHGYIYAHDM